MRLKWFRYLVTRYEPTDGPQAQMVGFMQALFSKQMLKNPMLKSTAISDAGITNQSLYEVERSQFIRATYDRAIEALNAVNEEITRSHPSSVGTQMISLLTAVQNSKFDLRILSALLGSTGGSDGPKKSPRKRHRSTSRKRPTVKRGLTMPVVARRAR